MPDDGTMANLPEILDDTIRLLETMKQDGVTHVNVAADTLVELGRPVVATRRAAVAAPPPAASGAATVASDLAALEQQARACTQCRALANQRTNVVFGVGNPHAELMFIGEAPGRDEDLKGEPFVGRAGQLLTKIIQAMGFARHEVYIANVLKCRPPDNRQPEPDETANCRPYLLRQIEIIRPKVLVALGATAMKALLDVQLGITKMRGNWYTFHGTPLMPTFHPAYLLRNPKAKREVWLDMQVVVKKLGREIPVTNQTKSTS